jgi:hypothetical protein
MDRSIEGLESADHFLDELIETTTDEALRTITVMLTGLSRPESGSAEDQAPPGEYSHVLKSLGESDDELLSYMFERHEMLKRLKRYSQLLDDLEYESGDEQ